ncbi:universal stress protein [Consotaella salsifontis]|uniref:Universal stress protein family protein n=1 Tax=Consotaella salsifontis TaxID=1365950 RepID=A0A1T4RBQ5_9HYPH|nr:universal stress protein [Consotaella salsifontis]SKA13480.1 Universal stress protein family protein [Consotaella salsifontis]
MTYRRILVQLDIESPAEPRLRLSCELARQFSAELIGFAAYEKRPPLSFTTSFAVDVEYLREYMEKTEGKLNKLRHAFSAATDADEAIHAVWKDASGSPTLLLANQARSADLLILGTDDNFLDAERSVDIGAILISAGRPVLLPAVNYAPLKGETVLVAWNDTRESRRAVMDALPFLARASHVLVLTVTDKETEEQRESLFEVLRYLARHECKARSEIIVSTDRSAADILTETAHRMGADLIVFGGYGHSRLREWAMGGVTRALIHDGSLHRLVSS